MYTLFDFLLIISPFFSPNWNIELQNASYLFNEKPAKPIEIKDGKYSIKQSASAVDGSAAIIYIHLPAHFFEVSE